MQQAESAQRTVKQSLRALLHAAVKLRGSSEDAARQLAAMQLDISQRCNLMSQQRVMGMILANITLVRRWHDVWRDWVRDVLVEKKVPESEAVESRVLGEPHVLFGPTFLSYCLRGNIVQQHNDEREAEKNAIAETLGQYPRLAQLCGVLAANMDKHPLHDHALRYARNQLLTNSIQHIVRHMQHRLTDSLLVLGVPKGGRLRAMSSFHDMLWRRVDVPSEVKQQHPAAHRFVQLLKLIVGSVADDEDFKSFTSSLKGRLNREKEERLTRLLFLHGLLATHQQQHQQQEQQQGQHQEQQHPQSTTTWSLLPLTAFRCTHMALTAPVLHAVYHAAMVTTNCSKSKDKLPHREYSKYDDSIYPRLVPGVQQGRFQIPVSRPVVPFFEVGHTPGRYKVSEDTCARIRRQANRASDLPVHRQRVPPKGVRSKLSLITTDGISASVVVDKVDQGWRDRQVVTAPTTQAAADAFAAEPCPDTLESFLKLAAHIRHDGWHGAQPGSVSPWAAECTVVAAYLMLVESQQHPCLHGELQEVCVTLRDTAFEVWQLQRTAALLSRLHQFEKAEEHRGRAEGWHERVQQCLTWIGQQIRDMPLAFKGLWDLACDPEKHGYHPPAHRVKPPRHASTQAVPAAPCQHAFEGVRIGIDPGGVNLLTISWQADDGTMHHVKLTYGRYRRETGLRYHSEATTQRYDSTPVLKAHQQRLTQATGKTCCLAGFERYIDACTEDWDAVWSEVTDPWWNTLKLQSYSAKQRFFDCFFRDLAQAVSLRVDEIKTHLFVAYGAAPVNRSGKTGYPRAPVKFLKSEFRRRCAGYISVSEHRTTAMINPCLAAGTINRVPRGWTTVALPVAWQAPDSTSLPFSDNPIGEGNAPLFTIHTGHVVRGLVCYRLNGATYFLDRDVNAACNMLWVAEAPVRPPALCSKGLAMSDVRRDEPGVVVHQPPVAARSIRRAEARRNHHKH